MTDPMARTVHADRLGIRILVVGTSRHASRTIEDVLSRAGYLTSDAASFEEAKHLLATERPALVITELRLAEFNGLHIFLRGRLDTPDMAGIIISPVADSILAAEARRMGATFLVEPVEPPALLEAVSRSLAPRMITAVDVVGPSGERRVWERRQTITIGFSPERRMTDRRRAAASPRR